MGVTVTIRNGDVARHMADAEEDAMRILTEWANHFPEVGKAEAYAARLASEHTGSVAESLVAPFLRCLAAALEAEEETFGQSDCGADR